MSFATRLRSLHSQLLVLHLKERDSSPEAASLEEQVRVMWVNATDADIKSYQELGTHIPNCDTHLQLLFANRELAKDPETWRQYRVILKREGDEA